MSFFSTLFRGWVWGMWGRRDAEGGGRLWPWEGVGEGWELL